MVRIEISMKSVMLLKSMSPLFHKVHLIYKNFAIYGAHTSDFWLCTPMP